MKISALFSLTAALLLAASVTGFTQDPASLTPKPQAKPGTEKKPGLTHFDLDFPGGTPAELASAISKAMGKHLNLIIQKDHANTQIMPIKVEGVTVPELFRAIVNASNSRVALPPRAGYAESVEYRDVSIEFITAAQPVIDESLWSFVSNAPSQQELTFLSSRGVAQKPPQVCRYFQLDPFLENYTIEDITTAIQTGWKMLKIDPPPQLSFHKETKLLIAVGQMPDVEQIPRVLDQLAKDNEPAAKKMAKWLEELADIKAKKEPGWDRKASDLASKIRDLADLQNARLMIQDPTSNNPSVN